MKRNRVARSGRTHARFSIGHLAPPEPRRTLGVVSGEVHARDACAVRRGGLDWAWITGFLKFSFVGSLSAHYRKNGSKVQTVSEYIDKIKTLSSAEHRFYRGHAKSSYLLEASIFRKDVGLKSKEHEILRDLITFKPDGFPENRFWIDRLVHAQHFGLPTRLLDVTSNALVALYFACEDFFSTPLGALQDGSVICIDVASDRLKTYDSDTISCVANLSRLTSEERDEISDWIKNQKEDGTRVSRQSTRSFNKLSSVRRLVQFVKHEKPFFENKIKPLDLYSYFVLLPTLQTERVASQSGAFLASGILSSFRNSAKIRVENLIIPSGAKRGLLAELDSLGVNRRTLFPDLENAAYYIAKLRPKIL